MEYHVIEICMVKCMYMYVYMVLAVNKYYYYHLQDRGLRDGLLSELHIKPRWK